LKRGSLDICHRKWRLEFWYTENCETVWLPRKRIIFS
jgi:hypothetical protein